MKHADDLIKRNLFLDGLTNVQRLNHILIGQDVREVLECDGRLEEKAMADLRNGIAYFEQVRDYVSRDLFSRILADEAKHADFIHTQFELIRQIGIENYIHKNSGPAGEGGHSARSARPATRRPAETASRWIFRFHQPVLVMLRDGWACG